MSQDPYRYFRIEAHELVDELAKGVLDLEKRADAELVARLLRQAHTLKGAARIVKHRELADLAHALEDALEPLRHAPVAQRHDAALGIVDRMQAQLAALVQPAAAVAASGPGAAEAHAAAGPRNERSFRADDPPILPPRADAAAIDEALVGLAAVHATLDRARAATDPLATSRLLEQADRALREVRKDVEQLRLSQAGALFTPLERTARDAAVAAGKRVAFASTGAAVRVDADVLAAVHPALVQLVRNAVVHGIEAPHDRAAAGKPSDGRVAITVAAHGRRIAITCEDDGGGVDLAAIQRAAERRGLVRERTGDPAQLFELLLRGGITTSREVNELAGRGIGLDLVRDTAQRLGGEVSVRTSAGAGTAITLLVPISASSIAVVVVASGGQRIAIPQSAVRRVSRIGERDLVASGDGIAIAFDDAMVPCAPLFELLRGAGARGGTAVFLDDGDRIAAVTVERVIGVEDAIVRVVPAGVPVEPTVWGIAIDPSGQPCPVVDARVLVAAAQSVRYVAEAPPRPIAPVLVVDDSLTTRMLEQSILESAGFEVELATSAEQALEKLGRGTYSLMLVDVEMPGMDGFTLVATIRSRPALATLPAILVTSRDEPGDRKRGFDAGAQGYVVKGQFDQSKLVAMIRELVQRSSGARPVHT